MKTGRIYATALALALAACAQTPKPAAPVVAAAASAPPVVLVAPAPEPVLEPAVIVAAQRNLKALGYAAGKPGDATDPALQHAILAFQKDQGLEEDGRLTMALADRLKMLRAEMLKAAANSSRSAVFAYSDGTTRRQGLGFLLPPPDGLVSNAPANFLQPLHAGSHGSYQLGRRANDKSFTPVMTVTCKASRAGQSNTPLNFPDAVTVDCRADANPLQWRAIYSARLGAVLQFESAGAVRDLVAIRPVTGDWPSAARTGLDWALTHALDTPGNVAVQWSSTGVSPHFEISAGVSLAGREAGLSGQYAALACRRFEMVQTGAAALHYPGIACQTAPGSWSLPGGATPLASPASGMASRSAPHAPGSALN